MNHEVKEDERSVRKIISRLLFIRSDLDEIKRLDIRQPEIESILVSITSRVNYILNRMKKQIK